MAIDKLIESRARIFDLKTSRLLVFYLYRLAFGRDVLCKLLVHLGAQLDRHVLPNAKFLLLVHGDVGQALDRIATECRELFRGALREVGLPE